MKMTLRFSLSSLVLGGGCPIPPDLLPDSSLELLDRLGERFLLLLLLELPILEDDDVAETDIAVLDSPTSSFPSEAEDDAADLFLSWAWPESEDAACDCSLSLGAADDVGGGRGCDAPGASKEEEGRGLSSMSSQESTVAWSCCVGGVVPSPLFCDWAGPGGGCGLLLPPSELKEEEDEEGGGAW